MKLQGYFCVSNLFLVLFEKPRPGNYFINTLYKDISTYLHTTAIEDTLFHTISSYVQLCSVILV